MLYEADRRRYQELGKRAAELTVEHEKLTDQIKQKETLLKDLRKAKTAAKSSEQIRKHIMSTRGVQLSLVQLKRKAEEVGAEMEEVWEQIDAMRTSVRAE